MRETTPLPKLTDYKVLIFDVYGTLADWETGLHTALQPLLSKYTASSTWSRKDALTAFGSVETDLQAEFPQMLYSDLLAKCHEVLEERLKALSNANPVEGGETGSKLAGEAVTASGAGETSAEGAGTSSDVQGPPTTTDAANAHTAFGASIPSWPIFPDTHAALICLSKHFKLVVLSNVDRVSFAHTHLLLSEFQAASADNLAKYTYPTPNPNKFWHPQATPGSNSPFTLILTAQDTGCYKPALGGFLTAFEYIASQPELFGDLGLGPDEVVKDKVLSVAQSLPHDHEPASELGMKSVWIDRQSAVTCNEETPGATPKWTWRYKTLGQMADAVEEELSEKSRSSPM